MYQAERWGGEMVKIALVGGGRHMRTTLVPHLARLEGIGVEVCVDTDEETARRLQYMTGARGWAASIEEIDTDSIDAAILALPANAHFHVASYLIDHGIACFVEKPPANTTDEIKVLQQLASAREVNVQVGFNFRFAEAMVAFHTRVAEHRNGPCTAAFEFRSKHPSGPEWGIEDPVAAWLYHNGVHALDLVLWTVGDAQQVYASIARTREEKFTIVAMIEHSDASVSTLELGTLTDTFDLRANLYTADACRFSLPHLGEAAMLTRNGRTAGEVLYRPGNLDSGWGRAGYGPELIHFLENYSRYREVSPSLLDALKASELCDAMMYSLRTGKICRLD
jgi:predicted dehydrogenase